MKDRMISAEFKNEDGIIETGLRPRFLKEFIGQDRVKEKLSIFMGAAKQRRETLDHVLLYGPPGLGKTTMAGIIANEMGVSMRTTSGPVIEKTGDVAAILTNLGDSDVLFIDEIHRLNRSIEEILYPAMEDYALDIIIGKGPSARSIRLDLPRFTLVGATTRAGMLTSPLRERFGIISRLDFYEAWNLEKILIRSAGILNIEIDKEAAGEIAVRSRGTPRIANRLLKRVRDYSQIRAEGKIDLAVTREALELLEVDKGGLDELDRLILETIIDKFDGGPVGLDTISAAIGEESITIEDVIEPFLLQRGFINRTTRGRVATVLAYRHLGRELKEE